MKNFGDCRLQQQKLSLVQFNEYLYRFMDAIGHDHRIGPRHISLYLAVLHYYRQQGFENPVCIFGRDLRVQAKIASADTYHHCLKDLEALGYLRYEPSYSPFSGSLVYLK